MSEQAPDKIYLRHNFARSHYSEQESDSDHTYIRADIAERYRAALEQIVYYGKDRCVCGDLAFKALHPTQPAEGRKP